jgi:hypothetical protein
MENDTYLNYSRNGGGIKENVEEVNSSMIYLTRLL